MNHITQIYLYPKLKSLCSGGMFKDQEVFLLGNINDF